MKSPKLHKPKFIPVHNFLEKAYCTNVFATVLEIESGIVYQIVIKKSEVFPIFFGIYFIIIVFFFFSRNLKINVEELMRQIGKA